MARPGSKRIYGSVEVDEIYVCGEEKGGKRWLLGIYQGAVRGRGKSLDFTLMSTFSDLNATRPSS